ncbi:hypothetical protein H4R24_005476 [Coemansia sp. RSA 988]|nr:hypothetical protein H4R24_005476 [Coemansia sp. RSA 988]
MDREVRTLFLAHFTTWLAQGDLDAGYAYISRLQETFNSVTRNHPCYVGYHQALHDAVVKEYGARHQPAHRRQCHSQASPQSDDTSYRGQQTNPTNAAGTCTESRRPLGGGCDQRRWPRNDNRQDRNSNYQRNDNLGMHMRRTKVEQIASEDEFQPADDDTGASDASDDQSWLSDDVDAQVVMIESNVEDAEGVVVHWTTVPPTSASTCLPSAPHTPAVTGTDIISEPPVTTNLLDLWRIPVHASSGGPEIAT